MNADRDETIGWRKLTEMGIPSQRSARAGRHVLALHRAVFAAPSEDEAHVHTVIQRLFPDGTKAIEVSGVAGWVYTLYDAYGTAYTLFVYHDRQCYQVQVAFPAIDRSHDPTRIHLTADGRLRPTDCDGFPTLAKAFQGSVGWVSAVGMLVRWTSAP